MSIVRQTFAILASIMILTGAAVAQADGGAQEQSSARAAVTAGASAAGVRFVSPDQARRMRLEVYSTAGERLFDSDFRQGSILDWDGQGLADGSYLCVVTFEDLEGKTGRRLSAVTLKDGRATLLRDGEEQLKAEYAQALAAAGRSHGDDALAVLPKGQAMTVAAHDGQDGQVTSTSGALTFRTGNVFAGKDKEHVRITPEGQVGIGTDKPEATLDVAGTVRARGGIVFDDGTVLKSATDVGAKLNPTAGANNTVLLGGSVTTNAAGSGTQGRIAKWTDGVGTLGNSVISETPTGFVGIGTSTPDTAFTVEAAVPTLGGYMSVFRNTSNNNGYGLILDASGSGNNNIGFAVGGVPKGAFGWDIPRRFIGLVNSEFSTQDFSMRVNSDGSFTYHDGSIYPAPERFRITPAGNVGIGTPTPTQRLDVVGNIKLTGTGSALIFADGTSMTTAPTGGGGGGSMTGSQIISAINNPTTTGAIGDNRLSSNIARLGGANAWAGLNTFNGGLSAGNIPLTGVGVPTNATDATNKGYVDANFVKFVPGAEQLSVGDANGTATMINLRGGSTCCSGPGGHTPAFFKVFQNGSFVATGNLGIGVSPMQGQGYRTSWDSYKGAFRSGYADSEWNDATVGFFSWAGGSNSTAEGLYSFAFGDTNFARSTSSIAFGSGNEVKGAAGFSAGAGNRVCDTYGVAFGNKAQSGGPLIDGKCDPDTFNIRGLAAVALGYNVTADQDHTTAMGKFATNNGFSGTFIWSDGSATAASAVFRNVANNEFAARASGGFRFRTNSTGTTGCNLPAGSGVFNCTSSRTTKENFLAVNGEDILARIRKVPVSTWNYITEGRQARHMGPMAEDFYQTFGLGTGNTSIGVQDLAGVSLAAAQALEQRTADLTKENEQLRSRLSTLEQRLASLEQAMQAGKAATASDEGQQR